MTTQTIWLRDFSGGENRRFSQNRIADNESARLRNARFTSKGALSKRKGTARYEVVPSAGTAPTILTSLYSYQLTSMGAEQLLIAGTITGGTVTIFRCTALGTYTALISSLGDNYEPHFATLGGKVYVTNGEDIVKSIDYSNTVADVTGAPKSRFIVAHKGYLFYFNDVVGAALSRLQWSNSNTPDTYTSTNYEDISPADGGHGTGMVSFGDELILFKGPFYANQSYTPCTMWSFLGDVFDASNPTFYLQKIPLPSNVGLVHARTAKIYKGALVFATNDGFYAYTGGGRPPEPISEIIRGEIDGWEVNDVHASPRRGAATVWKNKYMCSLYNPADAADTWNNRIYVFEDGKWWVDMIGGTADDFDANSCSGVDWTIFNNNLYSASGYANILRKWEGTSMTDPDDVASTGSVNFSYLTKEFDLEQEVLFVRCFVHLKRQTSGTLTFEVNTDQRGVTSVSINTTVGDSGTTESTASGILKKEVKILRRGRTIQFRLHNKENADIEIYAIELEIER